MDKLYIEGTKSTPEVFFSAETHVLTLRGQSYPENAFKFYEPLFQWVDSYFSLEEDKDVVIEFTLPYINTSSSKCVMMLLDKFDHAFQEGKRITLKWYYHPDNESEFECAEEFMEDLTFPFDILPREYE
ncbi:DUF1987 domain-containing protein [Ammoniphilus sp. CFH 90114]|uniref:DUF1987 domain-containing protein n=1 Tax=Ammoniphilus sp. CFH 90114 TaxID=2493665 RepID=UPI00100F3B72|nr:DUF1987 domain-containing protein [Ammoniphilus sp. CFH 90114]RXT05786.1 DUF1987 domain-containing protein [Ammoniphilus sp. CFH 90114]